MPAWQAHDFCTAAARYAWGGGGRGWGACLRAYAHGPAAGLISMALILWWVAFLTILLHVAAHRTAGPKMCTEHALFRLGIKKFQNFHKEDKIFSGRAYALPFSIFFPPQPGWGRVEARCVEILRPRRRKDAINRDSPGLRANFPADKVEEHVSARRSWSAFGPLSLRLWASCCCCPLPPTPFSAPSALMPTAHPCARSCGAAVDRRANTVLQTTLSHSNTFHTARPLADGPAAGDDVRSTRFTCPLCGGWFRARGCVCARDAPYL